MSRKYVGLDVHQSTTTMAVCSADGSFLFDEMHLSTESEAILTAIRGLDGQRDQGRHGGSGEGA
jgi:hypothetical protein